MNAPLRSFKTGLLPESPCGDASSARPQAQTAADRYEALTGFRPNPDPYKAGDWANTVLAHVTPEEKATSVERSFPGLMAEVRAVQAKRGL